ncbi:uncharacterized protein LOC8067025 isoform X2 [Sorghum bicolor]|uniref:uncharacterized protein LOC8067025 isoform X2 n=1 Tax=Sorghum bicolor TaxID=4558 RepID=UPI000B42407C|nr:uncharacterized protein LOC8067025 isoform X2 [Sorghum bicolor]|eukprot:XP_021320869.1 uncharacterized protein LOC8067025 isoform X2 [Sorghum bicolor]
MDGSASSGGFSGAGLPPRPTVSTTRRRPFVAPHSRAATSSSLDANLPRRQELPSPNSDGSGSRMPSPGGGRSGGRMPFPSGGLPRRLPNAPPTLGPRALSFTEPHAATWDAGRITTSPAEVYQVADDDFSPNHWTPDYSWEQEQKIMFCDVTTMDDDQRAYVKAKRAKIIKAMSASVGETASGESAV